MPKKTSGVPKDINGIEDLMKQDPSLDFKRYLIKGAGK